MVILIAVAMIIIFGFAAYEIDYQEKQRAEKARRMQQRVISARSGYKNLKS